MSVLQVREEDQDAREVPDGAHAARILPQRTDESDPARAGRRRGWRRGRRTRGADRGPTKLSKEAREKAEAELKKLKSMSPMSAEATVVRILSRLDAVDPVGREIAHQERDLGRAQEVLDDDHYGPREGQGADRRIPRRAAALEEAEGADPLPSSALRAWARRRSASRWPRQRDASSSASASAACGTNPRSAATAGTYIGSMPGEIIQALKKGQDHQSADLLDGIDKMGQDFRGRHGLGPCW